MWLLRSWYMVRGYSCGGHRALNREKGSLSQGSQAPGWSRELGYWALGVCTYATRRPQERKTGLGTLPTASDFHDEKQVLCPYHQSHPRTPRKAVHELLLGRLDDLASLIIVGPLHMVG